MMRSSYEEMGIDRSPFVFPAWVRRMVARVVSNDARLFAGIVWILHRIWGFIGRKHSHPMARSWSITNCTHSLQQPQYFVAGVPSARGHDTDPFLWKSLVKERFEDMRREAMEMLADPVNPFGQFRTEIEGTIAGWNSNILYANGRRQDANCERAPT